MESIKNMLIGLAIILITILVHISIENLFITDFIAVIGLIFVFYGYFSKDNGDKK